MSLTTQETEFSILRRHDPENVAGSCYTTLCGAFYCAFTTTSKKLFHEKTNNWSHLDDTFA
ncbi:hypothetical protein CEV34_1333 [Brucella pseudogrignonensis]|uniref:Uncharacterized protein n=1 Tax=Brucella pseudogrignonensis TaxID=419475 RepID=A0A256GN17_9HYPH|nr:hypothetical protein CEV34_1333 [Brucella pseudogrignonensis]